MAVKVTKEAKAYSISGIHRSTNTKGLNFRVLGNRKFRAVNNIVIDEIRSSSLESDSTKSFSHPSSEILNGQIHKRADLVTDTGDDMSQQKQQSDSSTDSNVSNDNNTRSKESDGNNSSHTTANESTKTTTANTIQKTTAMDNGKASNTADQVIIPVFYK